MHARFGDLLLVEYEREMQSIELTGRRVFRVSLLLLLLAVVVLSKTSSINSKQLLLVLFAPPSLYQVHDCLYVWGVALSGDGLLLARRRHAKFLLNSVDIVYERHHPTCNINY